MTPFQAKQIIQEMFKNLNKTLLLVGGLFFIAISLIYTFSRYDWRTDKVETISIYLSKSSKGLMPTIYLNGKNDIGFNFSKPYKSIVDNDSSLIFKFEKRLEIRKFRLYFEKEVENLPISKIVINKYGEYSIVNCPNLKLGGGLEVLINKQGNIDVSDNSNKGYLESAKNYLYPNDRISFLYVIIGTLICLLILVAFFRNFQFIDNTRFSGIKELSIIVFICSIFLPHPIFNITLIFSILMVIKDFKLSVFISNKINFLFIGLFVVLLFNDLFITESGIHNLKATERNILFLLLPIYVSCIKDKEFKFLNYFPISAIIIGVGFFLTSMVNAIIFKNINYFSFEEFAKYIHPVYFSYLLSFSIFYILLNSKLENKVKNILQAILFFFLILAGSKMIITLTLIIYAVLFVRSKKSIFIALFGVICLALFPPIQNRFKEIVNLNDIGIVKEKVIKDVNDPRVNGLTLRLLIWQETIKTVNTFPKFLVGIGLDDAADEALKVNLVNRGLEKYKRYSTHNQFLNTYMRTGVLGLFILILLVGNTFYTAIRKKNKMLLIMIVMFTFAMLTESVFQRVLGIYFFTTVLLFLMKPNFLDENSNNWN